MRRIAIVAALVLATLQTAAAQGQLDQRTRLEFPPEVLAYFRANMHKRMTDLDAVIASVANGKFKDAATLLSDGMAKHGNHAPGAPRPGQFVPPEFRQLDQVTHTAAGELALALSVVSTPPTAADYAGIFKAMSVLTATCSGCHGAYRVH